MSGIANHHSRVYLIESSELLEENTASFSTTQMIGWKPRTYARSWHPAFGRQKTWGSNAQGLTAEPAAALCGFVWWDLKNGLDEIWLSALTVTIGFRVPHPSFPTRLTSAFLHQQPIEWTEFVFHELRFTAFPLAVLFLFSSRFL